MKHAWVKLPPERMPMAMMAAGFECSRCKDTLYVSTSAENQAPAERMAKRRADRRTPCKGVTRNEREE